MASAVRAKLFVAQLTHQDPSSPMDTNDSMQQMASFSMVEQITNMASTNSRIAASLNTSSAVGLIGRTVTWVDAQDVSHSGTVEKVTVTENGKRSKRRKCTTQTITGPLTFTAGLKAHASLSRRGALYATGTANAPRIRLQVQRHLRGGRYTLTLSYRQNGHRIVDRATVTIS